MFWGFFQILRELGHYFVVSGDSILHSKCGNLGKFCGQLRKVWNIVSEMVMAVLN